MLCGSSGSDDGQNVKVATPAAPANASPKKTKTHFAAAVYIWNGSADVSPFPSGNEPCDEKEMRFVHFVSWHKPRQGIARKGKCRCYNTAVFVYYERTKPGSTLCTFLCLYIYKIRAKYSSFPLRNSSNPKTRLSFYYTFIFFLFLCLLTWSLKLDYWDCLCLAFSSSLTILFAIRSLPLFIPRRLRLSFVNRAQWLESWPMTAVFHSHFISHRIRL